MEARAHFSNIQAHIQEELLAARDEILVAVAWLTDRSLFDTLVHKAREGLSVQLAVTDDEINHSPQSTPFHQLVEAGGGFFRISKALMHHKFCIIDGHTIISGSYNWSYRARHNYENITIAKQAAELALQFQGEFARITGRSVQESLDTEQLLTRLDTLHNLIILQDWDIVALQVPKLKLLNFPDQLRLFQALENQQVAEAKMIIQAIQRRLTQVIPYDDPEIEQLRLSIKILEWEIDSLGTEIAETGRIINQYTLRHHKEVGEILERILRLKRDIQYVQVELNNLHGVSPEEQARGNHQYEEAQDDYRSYQNEQESFGAKEVQDLTPEEQQTLKQRYRKAASLCHPDRVHEAFQAQAHKVFIQLQEAYENNHLDKVTEIYQALEQGVYDIKNRSATLTEIEQLRGEKDFLAQKRTELLADLQSLQSHHTWQTITQLSDWGKHFVQLREQLEIEAGILEKQLKHLQQEIADEKNQYTS